MSKKEVSKKKSGYEVGYGKPPTQNQFKPGQSGNPKGRPKGQPGFYELFLREASRLVKLETPGGVQAVSKAEVVLRRLFNSANTGDLGASKLLLPYMAKILISPEAMDSAPSGAEFTIPDDEAIRRIMARFQHLEAQEEHKE
jgi:hypothetical protein